MFIKALSILLFMTFSILSCLHFYWLLGGKWALNKVIPKIDNNTKPIPPFATLVVAVILLCFGLLYIFLTLDKLLIPTLGKYPFMIIPSLFLLRAVGDFNYLGFFKKKTNSTFARADTKLFSPLCLLIAIIGFIVHFQSF